MARIENTTDLAFAYAHLHAWWSSSAQGEALEALASSATVDNFLHELQTRRIFTVRDISHVTNEIMVRQYNRLTAMAATLGGNVADYIIACRDSHTIANFKTLLNYRFFPERAGNVGDVLVQYPDRVFDANLLEDVMAAADTEQFIRLLPRRLTISREICDIIRKLDQDRDLVRASSAMDAITNRNLLDAAIRLPSAMRLVAMELHKARLDSVNAVTLMRNQHLYHLDSERLLPFWLNGGDVLQRQQWTALADAPGVDLTALVAQLPESLQRAARGEDGIVPSSVSDVERRLNCAIYRKAKRHFYNSVEPAEAVPAYIWLLRYETSNLCRIYEGLRFSMPIQDIIAMLIA